MGGCPNAECHARLDGLHKTMFGEEGRKGVSGDVEKLGLTKADKTCLKDYFKKPSGWLVSLIIAAILIPMVMAGVNIWIQQAVNPYVYAPASAPQDNRKNIIVLQENSKAISGDVADIKLIVAEQKREVNQKIDEVKTLIRQMHQ